MANRSGCALKVGNRRLSRAHLLCACDKGARGAQSIQKRSSTIAIDRLKKLGITIIERICDPLYAAEPRCLRATLEDHRGKGGRRTDTMGYSLRPGP
eukprot:4921749-Pyramimonas_sp.AAC.1